MGGMHECELGLGGRGGGVEHVGMNDWFWITGCRAIPFHSYEKKLILEKKCGGEFGCTVLVLAFSHTCEQSLLYTQRCGGA